MLRQIRDYNEADCRSTTELTRWLRNQQVKSGIPYLPVPVGEAKELRPETTARAAVAQAMLAQVPTDPQPQDCEQWRIHSLLAHLLEFHRREEKPSWWLRFERLAMTEQELFEDTDCLAELERTNRAPLPVKTIPAI